MTIRELLEKRGQLIAEADKIISLAESEKRDFTAEEDEKYNKLMDEQAECKKQADALQRKADLDALKAEMGEPEATRAGYAATAPGSSSEEEIDEARMRVFRSYIQNGEKGIAGMDKRDLQSSVFTDGGAIVTPKQFAAEIIKNLTKVVGLRALFKNIQLQSAQSLGAVALENRMTDAEWTTEVPASDISADTALKFGGRELSPKPLMKLAKISNTLLRLAVIPVESLLMEELVRVLAEPRENAFLNGTGVNGPLGLLTPSKMGIDTDRDVSEGNTATELKFDGCIEAKYAVDFRYWPNAKWIFNQTAGKKLRKLKDGDGQYIWQASVAAGEPDRLLDLPIVYSPFCPNTFTANKYVGIVGDFSNYWVVDSLEMKITRLVETLALRRQTGFLVECETDAMPVKSEAFARVKLGA